MSEPSVSSCFVLFWRFGLFRSRDHEVYCSGRYLKDHFQLDRSAEGEAGHSEHETHRQRVRSQHVAEKFRRGVGNLHEVDLVACCRHIDAKSHGSGDPVERSEVPARACEGVESGGLRGGASPLDAQLLADAAEEFGVVAYGRKHAAQVQESAGLDSRRIGAEGSDGRRKFEAGRFQAFVGVYHFPLCAPPSTCSTSPVTWRASMR